VVRHEMGGSQNVYWEVVGTGSISNVAINFRGKRTGQKKKVPKRGRRTKRKDTFTPDSSGERRRAREVQFVSGHIFSKSKTQGEKKKKLGGRGISPGKEGRKRPRAAENNP